MINNLVKILLLLFATAVFTTACKTKKGSVKPVDASKEAIRLPASAKLLYDEVIRSKNVSPALYFNADVDYKDDKQEIGLNIELQAKHGEYIWLNAKAMGFVNVARILLKPDSIRIIDLLNKRYISASYNYMRSFTNAPLGYEQLQNLVWGNALFDPDEQHATLDSLNNGLTILMNLGNAKQSSIHNKQLKALTVSLTEQGRNQQMTVNYGNFLTEGNNSFPQQIIINIQGEKKLGCNFTLSNFATEIKRDPQFVVPKSYKVQVL